MQSLRLFITLYCFCTALTSFSQVRSQDDRVLKEFIKADYWYSKALSSGNKRPLSELQESKFKQASLRLFIHVDSLLSKSRFDNDSLHFVVSLRSAELAHYFDSLQLALHYYLQAIALQRKLAVIQDSAVFGAYLFSGQIYFRANRLDSALHQFKNATLIQDKNIKPLYESHRLYNSLGVLYFQEGNYRQASNYFKKASDMLDQHGPYFRDFFVNFTINYAIALFKLENHDQAFSILKRLLSYKLHLNEIVNNLGLIEAARGDYKNALKYLNKVNYNNSLMVGLANDKASCWIALSRYDSARYYLTIANEKYRQYTGNHSSTDRGLTLKTQGDLNARLRNYDEALSDYQQALNQFYPAYKDRSVHLNPQTFTGVFSYINLFRTLQAKAAVMDSIYRSTHEVIWAKDELEVYSSSFKLLDYIENVYESDEARFFLEKSRYLIHDRPIELAFELFRRTGQSTYLEKAYEIDQRTKATLLAFNNMRNQVTEPSSKIRMEELRLKKAITRLSLNAGKSSDSLQVESTNRELHALEMKLGKIQETIALQYPSESISIPSIRSLQNNMLDKSSVLISYHLGHDKLSTFVITSSGFTATEEKIYSAFYSDLEQFITNLHTPVRGMIPRTIKSRLSSFLLKNIPKEKYATLIIIPDDELSFLPFECLEWNKNYLIESFAIQYQYSTLLLKKEEADFKKTSAVSFSPFSKESFTDTQYRFNQLYYSASETRVLKGTNFEGRQATKKQFLENLNRSDIVHLATHATVTDHATGSSYIVFAPWQSQASSDFLLYSDEVYNLNMSNNKLIMLSACETGHGKLIKGEGIMSLSRAFAYAGCPDIITSLWKADDEATAYIAQRFYENLSKGFSIAKSMQEAKKKYLDDDKINPGRKDPAYWANLVFVGNYKATTKPSIPGWMIIAVFVVLASSIYLYKKGFAKTAKQPNGVH